MVDNVIPDIHDGAPPKLSGNPFEDGIESIPELLSPRTLNRNVEAIKKAFDELGKVIQRVGTELYQAAEAGKANDQGAKANTEPTEANFEDVSKKESDDQGTPKENNS